MTSAPSLRLRFCMPRLCRVSGLAVSLCLFVLAPLVAVAAPPDSLLPPCPSSPNCVRTVRSFDAPPETVFAAAQQALDALGPTVLESTPKDRRAHAVYRVALVFKDDVDVAVEEAATTGSRLHIRSASRVGYSDLGVNQRRVDRFFRALDDALASP